ncbi:tRNA-splicing endonuclease subunit tsp-2 [Lecanosticta acicola]|uniref:tRNA-splicing endonuclease subunit Sen2 n=1 Tax=Lecanosticta acicola TaxID=111012 RepID=A0AAI9EEE2_9PEZI|nr:tRNA-splicing endonuclease subunit tsp-2 [Lecanosticta acicola]
MATMNGHVPASAPETLSKPVTGEDTGLNGQAPGIQEESNTTEATPTSAASPPKKPRKKKGPNYGYIHRKALPLEAHPLPAFHPTNPVSLLRLVYTYLSQLLMPPSSHNPDPYLGFFSPESRSVHVTDPKHMRALWEMGFFGKGTLSRSEPSWLDRETARLKANRAGGGTAEEATNARREKRRLFKLERARLEAEKIERQRLVEEGKLDPSVLEVADAATETNAAAQPNDAVVDSTSNGSIQPRERASTLLSQNSDISEEGGEEQIIVENQEFLQLTMEEAFFLKYGLGVLDIRSRESESALDATEMLRCFCQYSYFPPRHPTHQVSPDDPFLLNYVVYHHFRSLGWVVRPGVKFSVDYLLYYRGPVFSHAEFAIMIMPSYSDPYWSSHAGKSKRRIKEDEQKDWWWLHCINRVQSQVLKTLVLVYVDVPPPSEDGDGQDVGKLLKAYRVREFVIKRWVANRSRD